TLARLALLAFRYEDFSSLTAGQITLAFFRGLRFDAGAICLVTGPLAFLLMLPVPPVRLPLLPKIAGWACYATFVGFLFVLAADVIYFGYVHRHAGLEVTEPGDTLLFMSAGAVVQYVL